MDETGSIDHDGGDARTTVGGVDVDGPSGRGTGPRSAFLIAGALGLVLVAGAVMIAMRFLGGGGGQPASALPDDAIAYIGIDLDPPAGQKLEAYQFLRAFPDFREKTSGDSEDPDDLRQSLVELALEDEPGCDLTWQDDFAPWLGQRAALIARPGQDEPSVVIAVQVEDEEAARAGIDALDSCAGGDTTTGVVFSAGYAVLAETQGEADAAVAAADRGALEQLPAFDEMTQRTGQDGVIEAWFGEDALSQVLDLADGELTSEDRSMLESLYGEKPSGALTVRFADGGLEAVAAFSSDSPRTGAPAETIRLGSLPAESAVAFSAGVSEDYERILEEQLQSFSEIVGGFGPRGADPLKQIERQTGLALPADLLTLVGSEFALAVSEDVVTDTTAQFEDPSPMVAIAPPIALVTDSSEADVQAVLDKLRPLIAPVELSATGGAGGTAYGPDPAWNASLAGGEGARLGDLDEFAAVLPDVDQADGAMFVNFNSAMFDDIRAELSRKDAADFDDVVGPMSAFGFTVGADDDGVQMIRMRLGTD